MEFSSHDCNVPDEIDNSNSDQLEATARTLALTSKARTATKVCSVQLGYVFYCHSCSMYTSRRCFESEFIQRPSYYSASALPSHDLHGNHLDAVTAHQSYERQIVHLVESEHVSSDSNIRHV